MSTPTNHIQSAYWIAPGRACVLLGRNWKRDDHPPIKFHGDGLKMKNLRPMDAESIGQFSSYYEHDGHIIFCLDPYRYPQIDFEKEKVRVAGPFNDWNHAEDSEKFTLARMVHSRGPLLYGVAIPRERVVTAGKKMTFKFVTESWHWLTPLRCAPNVTEDKDGNLNYVLNVSRTGRHAFVFDVVGGRGMDQVAEVCWQKESCIRLEPGLSFYDLKTDKPCGACIENGDTVFRLFAPRATRVSVEIDSSPRFKSAQRIDYDLSIDQVTWELTLEGNYHGWYYRIFVDGPDDGKTTLFHYDRPLLDPWARATVGPEGPGIIIDPAQQLPVTSSFKATPVKDMSVLECHVRDLVRNAPLELTEAERRGFAGVTKFLKSGKTYLHEIGANTLEFQPIQQFDSTTAEEYHWGYMTNNYFAPCAWYGTKPEKGTQNKEFQEMVEACHEEGFTVLLDVVYNHVGEPPNLLFIDKAYYFHVDANGDLINWSGCGNVLRAESAMSTRLIIESLRHLVTQYGIDGFRFDLAELIGIDVLKRVADALRITNPDIVLITEPWSFRGSIQWDCRMAGYGFWNDGFREFLKKYVHGHSNAGTLGYYAKGCLDHMATWPTQSVNYVESHDDRCWLDDITENHEHNGEHPTHNDLLRTHMMVSVLYTSVGMPMISCGQDFMRSKQGIKNTYLMGDVNALNYHRIDHFRHTHEYFKKWIAFRQSKWGEILRLERTPGEGYLRIFRCENSERSCTALLFNADRALGSQQILLALNPHFEDHKIHLYDVDAEGWKPVADIWNFDLNGLDDTRFHTEHRDIYLGHMSLGLWVRE